MKLFIILALCIIATKGRRVLRERYSWQAVDYAFPNELERQRALLNQAYVPENNLPVGIEIWENKLFVTVPRWAAGVPSTLNYIRTDVPQPLNPLLIPYPSWAQNELGNCDSGLTTVYRIKVDQCNRLWVLDTGTFGIGNTTTNPCPYALNVFDLQTDRRIRRYVLRPEDVNSHTFIANIAIDIKDNCDDAFAYFSDELGYGLIVYSWEQNKSWRFGHGTFLPDPLLGNYNIGGLNFQWYDEGIFGINVSPINQDGYRTLFYSPLTSHTLFAVSTKVLRNSDRVDNSYNEFQVVGSRGRDTHTTSRVMTDDGVMFFNLIDQNAVGCWNSQLPLRPDTISIVDKDDVAMIFPSDVKLDPYGNIWVISDRMPNQLLSTLDLNDVNFRVFSATVQEAIQGTLCDPRTPHLANYNAPTTGLTQLANYNTLTTGPTKLANYNAPTTGPTKLANYNIPSLGHPQLANYLRRSHNRFTPNVPWGHIAHPEDNNIFYK